MQARTVFLVCLLGCAAVSAQAGDVDIGGHVLTDWRAATRDGQILWNENRLSLELDASPAADTHVFANVWVRGFGETEARSSADLLGHNRGTLNPWDLVLREAYIDLYAFLSPNLDLRIGRQRIAWGTADEINPTDNLNPDDLEDIWDFGRHIPTNSALVKYYWGKFTVSGVFIPEFTPVGFPPPNWAAALAGSSPALAGDVVPSAITDELDLPDRTLKEQASGAVKLSRTVLNYDVSMSYYAGRSGFPVISNVTIDPDGNGGVAAHSVLSYPRMDVLGADMSGAIGDIGIWAEAGVFFPEDVRATIDASAAGGEISEVVNLSDEPFVRYVVGGDYTFPGGLYLNGQFVHGFVHELGRGALHDYLVGGLEKKFRNDTVKLTVAAAIETPDISDAGDNHALIGMPELAYYPADNSEITAGVRLISGKGQSNFGQLSRKDEGFLSFMYSF